ncbi:uncharacterized protein LOC121642870 isoform X1 [Melanotaenia boesemani]|nr:uncharacterized protein LOC121642870 isoform X1 [Melanotaenia boesemani]
MNKDIYETLSPVEKQLSQRLTHLVTRGKRGRKVPILLLERTKASLDFLIKKRREVGILEENPFLFARLGTTTNLRGCDCLRRFAEESKAKNPELLRSTKLRKQVATLCQLLNLDSQELEQVARFMGHDIRVHCDYYRQTDKTFQVAKIGKLLFAMEHGAESLKGRTLQTLDSVISDKGHAATPIKGLNSVNERRTSDAGRQQEAHDDGEVPHSAAARSPVKRLWQTARRRHDEDGCGADEDDGINNTIQGFENADEMVYQERCGTPPVEQNERSTEKRDDDGWDEKDRKGRVKRQKENVNKRKRQVDDDWDGEERQTADTRSPLKGRKKTAATRERNNLDVPEMEVKKQGKRPWTDKERTAVKRQLAKFIALKKVPAKEDCMMCICKESPVLRTRSWKDVKYFVYNEIVKIKKKLAFCRKHLAVLYCSNQKLHFE